MPGLAAALSFTGDFDGDLDTAADGAGPFAAGGAFAGDLLAYGAGFLSEAGAGDFDYCCGLATLLPAAFLSAGFAA